MLVGSNILRISLHINENNKRTYLTSKSGEYAERRPCRYEPLGFRSGSLFLPLRPLSLRHSKANQNQRGMFFRHPVSYPSLLRYSYVIPLYATLTPSICVY